VHSKNAERLGGKKGGKAQAWNKGLTKNIDTRLAKQAKSMLGEKNHFYKKQHTQESINKIKIAKLISRSEFAKRILLRSTDFELLTTYEDYFSRQQQYLQLKCKKCNTIQEKTLQAFERGSICYVCFPNNTSNEERELRAFIEHITDETLIYNSRKIISPKELDIYIPSKNIAIEYNGLYWHSRDDKDKNDHKLKTLLCRDKDIKLIHIFSDEWKYKRNICKSIIKHKIGITKNRIFARKCVIKEVNSSSASKFFNDSHISGYSPSKIIFGLFYESKLVSALSLRKPRHNAYVHSIEICRFASQLNTSVIGGFSKLLKHVIRWCYNNNINKIITYADLRFNNGDVYKKNSFTFIKDTGLDYWYTDGVHRYNRFKFRAQNGVSEKEVALKAKVTRIYGCGNNLYEMKLT
tara:strand:- start:969 stop:2192 length:1224 start_codon:yes stop_codon:yes gene_type:complete